ncbi:sugar transferase [candidate division WOR-3 bacterium]|nr:sugar transferase [candidate division WOR-3 bacterium]
MIQQRQSFNRWLITLFDILIIIFTYWLAVFLRSYIQASFYQVEEWYFSYYISVFPVFLITFIPVIILNNSVLETFPVNKYKFYTRTIISLFIAVLISIALLFYFKLFKQSRVVIFIFFVMSAFLMSLSRELISKNKNNIIRTIVLGSLKEAELIKELFSLHAFFKIEIIDVFEDTDKTLIQRLKNEPIDWVIITENRFKPFISFCENLGITVSYYLKEEFKDISPFVSIESTFTSPIVTFHVTPQQYIQLFLKYTTDRIIAFILLICLSPLLLLISIIIKFTYRGPIIYKHKRAGLNGRRFDMLKFRTMFENADEIKPSLISENVMDKIVFKMRNDPRITKVGRILRRFSLDELPQLLNVLKGEMSLVGPRPPLPEEVNKYEGWERRRLSMKPGLTCLWQISGRSEIGFEEWMKLDLEYIDSWSPTLDIVILFKTIPAVISGRGAY